MTIDLGPLVSTDRLLFKIPLKPVHGHRFQPTGFPSLGAATYQTDGGTGLLVESAQSMANRLELTIWDAAQNDVREELRGLSHVRVFRRDRFFTDTILESHRLNSPYLLKSSDRQFLDPFLMTLRKEIGKDTVNENEGFVDRHGVARTFLKYDCNSLVHGCFLSNNSVKLDEGGKGKAIAGGRVRVARTLSAFIEADSVQVAPSGGVRNDHVNPSGDTKAGFGNVLFARDEYTAESITLYVNLDLAQIRGYGLGEAAERLLILLSLFKVRALVSKGMRLRTACDLIAEQDDIRATMPSEWSLPRLDDLKQNLASAIKECSARMEVTDVTFDDELRKGKVEEAEEQSEPVDDE